MIPLPASTRVFVATRPVDMRKGHNGLCALAEQVIGASPWEGHIFCWFNQQLDRCKLLWWDGSGLVVYYKRLEKSRFAWRWSEAGTLELSAADLFLVLDGLDPKTAKRRPRWMPPQASSMAYAKTLTHGHFDAVMP